MVAACEGLRAELIKVESGPPGTKFDYSTLQEWGGKNGFHIPETALKAEYRDWTWSLDNFLLSAGKQPCDPVYEDLDPAQNCNMDLNHIRDTANRIKYLDLAIVEELCTTGFHNRASVDRRSMLMPNYPGFYDHVDFNTAKLAEKRGYQPPRLHGPFDLPPFIPFRVSPKNVVVQISDGAIKYRATSDFGAPRPAAFGSRTLPPEEDWSVNGCINLKDPVAFPTFEWSNVRRVGAQAAIMATCGLAMTKFKTDFAAYYETLPRCSSQWWQQIQCVSGAGFDIDPRLVFGNREAPALANRISFFFVNVIRDRLRSLQASWLRRWRTEPPPTEWSASRRATFDAAAVASLHAIHEQATTFSDQDRRTPFSPAADSVEVQAGSTIAWQTRETFCLWSAARVSLAADNGEPSRFCGEASCIDVFFDDVFGFFFTFAAPHYRRVMERAFAEMKVQLADGSIDKAHQDKPTLKNKTEFKDAMAHMTILGLEILVDVQEGSSQIIIPEEKVAAYTAKGVAIQQAGRKHAKHLVDISLLETFMGQILFCAQACPTVKGPWQLLLQLLKMSSHGGTHVQIGPAACRLIDTIVERLHTENGVEAFPRSGPPGSDGVPVVWRFSDAAMNDGCAGDKFVGCGSWQWLEGDDTILFYCCPFTHQELQLLDINTLEFLNVIMAEELFRPFTEFPADVVAACDNINAIVHVLNGAKAKAGPLRAAYNARMHWVRAHPAAHRILGCHVRREFNKEADLLSRGLVAEFQAAINKRFGREMKFVQIPTAECSLRDTRSILRLAHDDVEYRQQQATALQEASIIKLVEQAALSGKRISSAHRWISPMLASAMISNSRMEHGTAFLFEHEGVRCFVTAAHCFRKCQSCQRCETCSPRQCRQQLSDAIDCKSCRACSACDKLATDTTLSLEGRTQPLRHMAVLSGSLLRNNRLDIAVFLLSMSDMQRLRKTPAIELAPHPEYCFGGASMTHYRQARRPNTCTVGLLGTDSTMGPKTTSGSGVKYGGTEPHCFSHGASGAAVVNDNSDLLSIHTEGSAGHVVPGGVLGGGTKAQFLPELMTQRESLRRIPKARVPWKSG